MSVREWGQGQGRSALMLHCSNARKGAWRGLAALLEHDLHMIAPDLPSHGDAPDWDGQGTFHDAATAAMQKHMVPGRGIIGHSFGATVAIRLALQAPADIPWLILMEPVLFAAAGADNDPEYDAHLEHFTPFEAHMRAGEHEAAAAFFTEYWGAGLPWSALSEKERAYISDRVHLIPATAPELFEDRAGLLRPDALEGFHAPVLFLRGERSPPVIPAVHAALMKRFPNTREAVITGAGHMLPITHPEQCAAEITKFLETI